MTVHKLALSLFEEDFELIAIHTSLTDYKLIYFVNKVLKISLIRKEKEFITNPKSFPYYHYIEPYSELNWHCIGNKISFEMTLDEASLFTSVTCTNYLIDRLKNVDFFLKIDTEDRRFDSEKILKKISQIPYIIKAYPLDVKKLSSQHKLIFQEC